MRNPGPNVRKLIAHQMAVIAIPPGSGAGTREALDMLTDPKKLGATWKEARAWVEGALAAIKAAPDNTFGNDDEVIAHELLKRINAAKK